MTHSVEVLLEPAEEGGFTVYVPTMPGCISEGDTEEEALDNITDAIREWLNAWEEIEAERGAFKRMVTVER